MNPSMEETAIRETVNIDAKACVEVSNTAKWDLTNWVGGLFFQNFLNDWWHEMVVNSKKKVCKNNSASSSRANVGKENLKRVNIYGQLETST